jgi:hypothetical protein
VTGPGPGGSGSSVWVSYVTYSPNQIVVQGAPVTGLGAVGAFGPAETVPGSGTGIFGAVAVGPGGQVLVSYQTPFGKPDSLGNQNGRSHVFTSLDPDGLGPAGFSPHQDVTSLNISADALIPAQPHQGVDAEVGVVYDRSGGPHRGRAYMVYSDKTSKGGDDTNVFVRFSDDDGTTWSGPARANDDPGTNSQFLPRIALDQTTGYVAASWYDCRNDLGAGGPGDADGIANDEAQFWATVSADGGLSFAPNVQVSAGTSSANAAWTGINQDYGDYTGLDFYGGKFYPAWADNSNSTGDNPPGTFRFFDVYTAAVTVTVTAPAVGRAALSAPPTAAVTETAGRPDGALERRPALLGPGGGPNQPDQVPLPETGLSSGSAGSGRLPLGNTQVQAFSPAPGNVLRLDPSIDGWGLFAGRRRGTTSWLTGTRDGD